MVRIIVVLLQDEDGYSEGVVQLDAGVDIFVGVGGRGTSSARGYNGGGGSGNGGRGGGATHMALRDGLLSSLEGNISDVLIVAGGGGGLYYGASGSYTGDYRGHGGGYEGSKGYSGVSGSYAPGGCQTLRSSSSNYPRGTFGQGGKSTSYGAGGGGGFYGGSAGRVTAANSSGGYMTNYGGGGSGYLSPALSEGCMWIYKGGPLSDEETIRTKLAEGCYEEPVEKCAKLGDGYARIILVE